MVIKVDFDLAMSILAHNIYRVFALDLDRYANLSDERVFEKFISNSGSSVKIASDGIMVELKKNTEFHGTNHT